MLKALSDWYLARLADGGYALVALLMDVEGSSVPLPSEIVIPPAAYLFYNRNGGGMPCLIGLTLAGAIGSWLGATVMYWASRLGGRPFVMRFGRYVGITHHKVEMAEHWAGHYGPVGIFISRLLPVIRHLIGIPAGIVRMNFTKYSIYTLLGSTIWSAVLCWVGVTMGADIEETSNLTHTLSKWLGLGALVLGALYYFFVRRPSRDTAIPQAVPGED
jgi:membrane protein DedA with SNARE-associated domain